VTNELLPFQQDLADKLGSGAGGSRILVRAPGGVGIAEAAATAASRAAATDQLVVIVVPGQAHVEKWGRRLRAAGVESVLELSKAREAVIALDKADGRSLASHGAIVATSQLFRSGAGRRTAASLKPALLIIEQPPLNVAGESKTEELHSELVSYSLRSVVLTYTGATFGWYGPTETLDVTLTEALLLRPQDNEFSLAHYGVEPEETALLQQARDVVLGAGGSQLRSADLSRPALHGMLLRLATELSGESLATETSELAESRNEPSEALIDEVWQLLDRVESLGTDPRLELLTLLVRGAVSEGRPVVIRTSRVDETEYVAGHLRDLNLDVRTLSGSTDPKERRRLSNQFGAGTVLVVTRAVFESIDLPDRCEDVWWTTPNSEADLVRHLTRAARGGRTVAMLADPPRPADIRFRDALESLWDAGLPVRKNKP
jgi:hypothetical protein